MKIKNKLYLSAGISVILGVSLITVVLVTSDRVSEQNTKHRLMMDVRGSVTELDIITYDYLLHREERMEQQWNLKFNSLGEILKKKEALTEIRDAYIALGDLFSQITANNQRIEELIQEEAPQETIDNAIDLEERLVAQLLVTSQSVMTDAYGLAEKAQSELIDAQRLAANLTLGLMTALAITLAALALLIARSISKPLSKLTDYSRRVGEGDYTADIEIKGKDEIASVASDVKSMVGQLLAISEGLRESEEKFRLLMEQSPVDIEIYDKDGTLQQVNKAWEEIYDLSPEGIVGKLNVLKAPHIKDIGILSYFEKAFAGEPQVIPDFEYDPQKVGLPGRACWLRSRVYPIKNRNGVVQNVVSVQENVTGHKQAEEARGRLALELSHKNKELEQMIYAVSHDLRSPLVNAEGFGEELGYSINQLASIIRSADIPSGARHQIESLLNEDIPESLRFILTSTTKMNVLLTGLLNLSRVGRQVLTAQTLEMNRVVASVLADLEFKIKNASVKLEIGELPPCEGDSVQIGQVFTNLVDNALKYLDPDRPGIIKISGREEEEQSIYCVEDNGIGIAPEHQDKVFEIFHQLNPESSNGEGLGLTIVRTIVERHHGEVRVESDPGTGSRFYISLPRVAALEGGLDDGHQ